LAEHPPRWGSALVEAFREPGKHCLTLPDHTIVGVEQRQELVRHERKGGPSQYNRRLGVAADHIYRLRKVGHEAVGYRAVDRVEVAERETHEVGRIGQELLSEPIDPTMGEEIVVAGGVAGSLKSAD